MLIMWKHKHQLLYKEDTLPPPPTHTHILIHSLLQRHLT